MRGNRVQMASRLIRCYSNNNANSVEHYKNLCEFSLPSLLLLEANSNEPPNTRTVSWHHQRVSLENAAPKVSNLAYVAPSATLAGNVEGSACVHSLWCLSAHSFLFSSLFFCFVCLFVSFSVWDYAFVGYDVAVRGDVKLVRLGAYSKIMDGTTISESFSPM